MYRLVTRESLEDEWKKSQEYKSRVVPLASDPRPEARQLLAELHLA